MKTDLLLVVDVQQGFLRNGSDAVLPAICRLMDSCRAHGVPNVCTRFINRPESQFERWIGWRRLRTSPEIDLHPDILRRADRVIDKTVYSSFTDEFRTHLSTLGTKRLIVCGIATDGCVLKSAVDAFELNVEPVVVEDACSSHAGPDVHKAGILLISRFIGAGQVRAMQDVLGMIGAAS
jgi:nicotinamidase-related amidase